MASAMDRAPSPAVEAVDGALLRRWRVNIAQHLEVLGLRLWEVTAGPMRAPLHLHEWAFFCALLDGELTNDYGSKVVVYRRAASVFHPPETLHTSDIGGGGARLLTLEASRDWIARAEVCGRLPLRPASLPAADGASQARRLVRELRLATSCSLLSIEGLTLELFAAAARASGERERPPWLVSARDLLHAEFRDSLTVSGIASRLGVAPSRLSRAFRAAYGKHIGDYVRALRVQAVARELETDAPISDIAGEAGFSDQAHCTRVFRLLMGTTPGAYRRRLVAQRRLSLAVDARPSLP